MANCINDCSAVRMLLTECQMAVLNNTLAPDVNVPTRMPICDAIHQVEADRPLLSQLLRIYNTLIKHARAWAGRVDVPGALSPKYII